MSTRKIEQLDEQTILGDNDLAFISVSNGAGYDSKKVTLASIANYIRNNTGEIPSQTITHFGPCGYEMIDTSEPEDGSYDSETISSYTSSSNKNYLWNFMVGKSGDPVSLEKTVSKDCFVWIVGTSSQIDIKIDDVPLNATCLNVGGSNHRFYLKSNQRLYVGRKQDATQIRVTIIPLLSGGKFFFDTRHPERFYEGQITVDLSTHTNGSSVSGNVAIYPGEDFDPNNVSAVRPRITAQWPTLFMCRYQSNSVTNAASSNTLLNGKLIVSENFEQPTNAYNYMFLNTGDTYHPYPAVQMTHLSTTYWAAYPLLMEEESGSGSNSGSCSYGYEIYDMSESNPSNDYFYNKVAVLNGTQDTFEHTFSQDCEIVLKTIVTSSILNEYLDAFVKIDDIPIHIGLLTNGEWGGYGNSSGTSWKMTTLFVKAGQKLSINRTGYHSLGEYQYQPEKIVLHSRPLKQGGDFFIDTSVSLEEPFTPWGNTISRFEAPRKTLFAWASATSAAASLADDLATMNIKPRLNGLQIYPHVRPGDPDDRTITQDDWTYSLYDRLVLDAGDVLTFETNVRYCAYPLLDNGSVNGLMETTS